MIRKTTFFVLAPLFIMACASTQMPINTIPTPKQTVTISKPQIDRAIISAPTTLEEVIAVAVAVSSAESPDEIVQGVETWWTYTIQPGDTTFRLMKRCGTLTKNGEDAFLKKNGIDDPNRIFAGAEVLLPCKLELRQVAAVHEESPAPIVGDDEVEVLEVNAVFDFFNEEDLTEELPQVESQEGVPAFWVLFLAALIALIMMSTFRRKPRRM